MPGKRPPGPVYRNNDDDTGDEMPTSADLQARWKYLQDGAELGGGLVKLARIGTMEQLGAALQTMTREQVEAACFAMVLVHAEGAPLVEDDA
jgi:hypothetical protein